MEISQNCPICGIKATQICSSCKSVKYCGVEHQKQHWKIHKNNCQPFSISKSDDIGRFLLATRDIKANSVIFNESPLIVGPKWYLNDKEVYNPIVPCVGCFIPVKVGESLCPNCHWPICHTNCTGLTNPKLHALECPILSLGPGPKSSDDIKLIMDYYRMDALIVLRCLMLQCKFPKKWKQFMDLESHEMDRIGSELFKDAEDRIVSYLQMNFLEKLKSIENQTKKKILLENDENILRKICGIIETNCMLINLPSGLDLTGTYYTACMMEHSCQPNCYFKFDYNDNFKISVVSGRDIKQGEHLKIMYSNMLWGTLLRQEHLQMTKHFICKCDRCKDPTELGTYFSGLKCIGVDQIPCENGIQLPLDPLDQNSDWKCNKCPVRINADEVRYLSTQIEKDEEELLSKKPTVEELESFIDKLSKILHKNHYHMFNLKHSLIQLYGKENSDGISDTDLKGILLKKIKICDELYEICKVFDPYTIRLSLYVVIILFEKHTAIVEITKKSLEDSSYADKAENKEEILRNFENARKLLLEAKEILKKELDTVNGLKLNETVIKSLTDLDVMISKYS